MGGEILSPVDRGRVGQPDGLVGHVEDFIRRFLCEHQASFKHRGCAGTGDGGVDGKRCSVIERGVIGEVHEPIENDTVVRNITRLTMFKHDVVHARCRWSSREAGQGEGAVRIGDVLVKETLLSGSSAGDERSIGNGCKIGKDTNILNGCTVGNVAKLASNGDGLGTITSHGESGDGLVDHLDLFGWWTRIKRNPSQVRVAVCTVLLKANFRPGGCIRGIDRISIAGPGATNITGYLSCWESGETGHGDKDCVEFTARAFLKSFKDIEGNINWAGGPRTVVVSFEFGRSITVDDEIFERKRRAVRIVRTGFIDDGCGDVPHVGVFTAGIRKALINQQFVREALSGNGGGGQV